MAVFLFAFLAQDPQCIVITTNPPVVHCSRKIVHRDGGEGPYISVSHQDLVEDASIKKGVLTRSKKHKGPIRMFWGLIKKLY